MKHSRHSVLRIPRPPGFNPSAPTDIPPEFVAIPRIGLGQAAAEALRLNAEEMAKGDGAAFVFVPMKCFESLPWKKWRRPAQENGTDQSNERILHDDSSASVNQ